MAVVSSNQGWFNTNSSLFFFDFSWFLGAAAIHAKEEEVQTTDPLLTARLVHLGCTLVGLESNSEAAKTVENRCYQDGENVPSSADLRTSCSRTVVQDASDLEISELKRMFQTLDENQDDLICAVDLHRFMGRLGFQVSGEEAVSMLATVDHDGDGHVGFEEFCTLHRSLDEHTDSCRDGKTKADDEEDNTLLEAFRVFDKNNDGFISCQELQSVLLALGLPEGKSLKSCELMIQGVDSDGNGEVDIKEFKQMMSSNSFQGES